MKLEIRHLRLVRAVAAVGGLTKAGRTLHLSQSALSHQLRDVEERLGTRLFLRVGKRMLLTSAGERLLRSAEEVLDALDRTEAAIRNIADGHRGRLRVSACPNTDYHWLPCILNKYRSACPAVDVQIIATGTADPIHLLVEGAIDVGIVADPIDDARVVCHPLFEDEIVAVVERRAALAARSSLRPADLTGCIVLLDSPADRHPVFQLMMRSGSQPSGVHVVERPDAMVELVKAGFGVGILPRWAIEGAVRSGSVRPVRLAAGGTAVMWRAAALKDMAEVRYVSQFVQLVSSCAAGRAANRLERERR